MPPIFCKNIDTHLFKMEEIKMNNEKVIDDMKKKPIKEKNVDGWTFIQQ